MDSRPANMSMAAGNYIAHNHFQDLSRNGIFAFRNQINLSKLILATAILLTATPIFLLMGTGWVQFGPRYTLDFTLPLLMLTAIGIRKWPGWVITILVLVSIVHYIVGTLFLSGFLA